MQFHHPRIPDSGAGDGHPSDSAPNRLRWIVETSMPVAEGDAADGVGRARRHRLARTVSIAVAALLVVALAVAMTAALVRHTGAGETGASTVPVAADTAANAGNGTNGSTSAPDAGESDADATWDPSNSSGAAASDAAASQDDDSTDTGVAKEQADDSGPLSPDELRTRLDELFEGASYALEVTDARTGKARVSIDAGTQFASASTYKLFIAQDMASKVEGGSMTWDSPLNGMSLSDCLTTMIVDSDNDCPIAWMETVSNSPQMTENARMLGATGTDFRLDGIVQTTAADLSLVLRGLYNHTIVSRDSATRIIDLMKRQNYRDGIPTGLGEGTPSGEGITVADKVGFLNGYLNDAAIVTSPKGDFTFVILTEGASWEAIAQAAALAYRTL